MNKPNVLFVDDEVRIVRSLKILFSTQHTFTTHIATSGRKALEIIRTMPIHVIVSDQRMPEMTGVNLLEKVRTLSPNTIGILLTGYADMDAIIASINEGQVFRYITKPWNNQQLREKISSAVEIAEKLFAVDTMPKIEHFIPELNEEEPQNILVLHPEDKDDVDLLVSKLFSNHLIHSISDNDEALNILSQQDISVIVTDIDSSNTNCTLLIKTLKEASPSALAVVVVDNNDSNLAISLINQGQVYRYLPKPVKTGRLKLCISSALSYYKSCQRRPVQLARHSLEKLSADEEKIIVNSFKSRLSSFRKRMFSNHVT